MIHGPRARRAAVRALAVSALAAQTACGVLGGDTHPCTLIGSPSGIGVEIAPSLARTAAAADLTACWDAVCRTTALRLREDPAPVADDPVMTTESAAPPATPPTAEATERPVRPGFAELDDLPAGPVRVTLELRGDRGRTVLERRTTVTPQVTYPNGRDCSPGGRQAQVALTPAGALVPR
ncbi:hypothetical protein ACIQ6Y_22100 [Streptomyces sp. NPDC096205]|uniref:hypothetical protein n=1 Tax=Streptomyces sp. NPDC096205 TaxID=3366081 RepID=UPI00381F7C05